MLSLIHILEKAEKADIPVFITEKVTSAFMAEVIRWLNVQLAPCISIHGVLVDVYGVGVLITGESGIGKSEAALEPVSYTHLDVYKRQGYDFDDGIECDCDLPADRIDRGDVLLELQADV